MLYAVTYRDVILGFFQGQYFANLAIRKHLDGSAFRPEWNAIIKNAPTPSTIISRLSSQEEFDRWMKLEN